MGRGHTRETPTDNHNRIALNLLTLLNPHLGGSECRFHSGNLKVNDDDEFYDYPAAFVIRDRRDRDDLYIKRYPNLLPHPDCGSPFSS
ncbi:MAG: Uma2 family endonuclease [Cyanobacteria bacterium REEB459]|nr:Uma2 family endonuclease [Cyanobacteria bacterium REEB459]